MHRVGRLVGLVLASSLAALSQSVPAHIIVTAGHYYSHQPPLLEQKNLTIEQGFQPVTITKLVPLTGKLAALELFVLVDDCSSCEAGAKFDELRRFIVAQPETTSVGVAYIHEGRLEIAQAPTKDRERAVKALNAPTGGKPANPFVALTELIRSWDKEGTRSREGRRAVLMISNGIDPEIASGLLDPTADAAIVAAERQEVTIFALYHPSADYNATDAGLIYAGQVQLSHVASESGGEAYLLGFGPLPSLAPFLSDVADHLANQYRLEFLAHPGETAGSLEDVTVRSTLPEIEVMAPAKAWIPGAGFARKGQ
jgi:hypothetical protein